jgi:hypothetical protein
MNPGSGRLGAGVAGDADRSTGQHDPAFGQMRDCAHIILFEPPGSGAPDAG